MASTSTSSNAVLQASTIQNKRIIILDFDGVLCIPYTHPEEPYPHMDALLAQLLAHEFTLCVASFNPLSRPALRRWGWFERFKAIRCGSNYHWDDETEIYSDITHRDDLCKSKQIADILESELNEFGFTPEHCAFFDDTPFNLDAVRERLPQVACVHVPSDKGLQWDHIVEAHK